jgi:hypothetical protein
MSLVQRRILEHLGAAGVLLLIGCHKPEAPAPAQDATVPAGTAAEPAPSATVGATATAVAPAVGPGGADVGGVCKTADDCKPGLHCQLEFDGASFSETGVCSTERPVYRGRPLYVEGVARMASIALGDATRDGDAWAAHFARAAVEEHASVAAFARTLCQLMALGAPLDLLERTQRALADEIEHTRGSLTWLAHFGGGEAAPGPLPEAVSPMVSAAGASLESLARDLLVDVVRGGCIGETLAAEAMVERAAQAGDPELAAGSSPSPTTRRDTRRSLRDGALAAPGRPLARAARAARARALRSGST